MAGFFCDSSAVVKRYVNEAGSNFVDSLADLKNGNVILLARITRVEIAAAIARVRGRTQKLRKPTSLIN